MEFDWKYYINKYPDLKRNGINSKRKALNHWIKKGRKEKRFPCKKAENKKVSKSNNFFNSIDQQLESNIIDSPKLSFESCDKEILNQIKNDISTLKKEICEIKSILMNTNLESKNTDIIEVVSIEKKFDSENLESSSEDSLDKFINTDSDEDIIEYSNNKDYEQNKKDKIISALKSQELESLDIDKIISNIDNYLK